MACCQLSESLQKKYLSPKVTLAAWLQLCHKAVLAANVNLIKSSRSATKLEVRQWAKHDPKLLCCDQIKLAKEGKRIGSLGESEKINEYAHALQKVQDLEPAIMVPLDKFSFIAPAITGMDD